MPPSSLNKLAVRLGRHATQITIRRSSVILPASILSASRASINTGYYHGQFEVRASNSFRAFSTTRPASKGLSPESEDPPIPPSADESNTESIEYNVGGVPAELTADQYNELADEYLNSLIEKLEELQEETEEVDCEYSAGVLTLAFPPNGTYVINKQPPNKQIWLSSPITGPKRYDYVIASEGQDAKEGTGTGEWVYLRDGSTLNELLNKELGVDMTEPFAPVPHLGE